MKIISVIIFALTATTASFAQKNETKFCLDSMVTVARSWDTVLPPQRGKNCFSYDNKGNNILQIDYLWNNEENTWKKYSKKEQTYDANNNLIKYTSCFWNEETNDWRNETKCEQTYDKKDNLIISIDYTWDRRINDWEIVEKIQSTYDNKGNKTTSIAYDWNDETSNWEKTSKCEYTYDKKNNLTMAILYLWAYKYDGNKVVQTEKAYDNKGRETVYIWRQLVDNEWLNHFKKEYTYDSNKKTHICSTGENGVLRKYSKVEYMYDNNGNQTMEICYHWDNTVNTWLYDEKYEYVFDLSYFKTNLISPAAENLVDANMRTTKIYYKWSETDDDWVQKTTTAYYWSAKSIEATKTKKK